MTRTDAIAALESAIGHIEAAREALEFGFAATDKLRADLASAVDVIRTLVPLDLGKGRGANVEPGRS